MKVGIISFAHMHAHSYAACLQSMSHVGLCVIWDNDQARGQAAAAQYKTMFEADLDKMLLYDIDAVIICSENIRHKEHVLKAAQAGKHILCEKPIATTAEDAVEMHKVCEQHNVILQIAFPVRYTSSMRQVKKLISEGVLGEIVAINSTNHGKMPGSWFVQPELSGGGAAIDHIVHVLDLVRWMLKDEVDQVYAELENTFYRLKVEDCGIVMLQFESGMLMTLDPSWSRPKSFPTWGDVTMEIVGSEGALYVDAFKPESVFYHHQSQEVQWLGQDENTDYLLIEDFIQASKTGHPTITAEDGLRALEVVLAAYKANKQKAFVQVERHVLS
jgi:predicted dehydrogenase